MAFGARVFITGRDKAQLDAALETLGNKATAVQGVVTDPGDLDRLYARIMEDTRAIGVLFANAGVVEFAKFGEVTEEHFHRVFDRPHRTGPIDLSAGAHDAAGDGEPTTHQQPQVMAAVCQP